MALITGFKQRSSKITPCIFIDLLLYCASLRAGKYSLSQGSAYLFETFHLFSSKQSIDKRFNLQAMNFVKAVLSHLVKNYIRLPLEASYFSQFARVRIKDSTRFILPHSLSSYYRGPGGSPGTSRAAVSIQFEYDLKTSSITDLALIDATRNDATDAAQTLDQIQPLDLIIRDLGYCTLEVIDSIQQQKAFFLFRLISHVAVCDDKEKEIDFRKIYRKMKKYHLPFVQVNVLIGAKHKIKVRLCLSLVSEEVYNQRLDKLKKSNQRKKCNISENSKSRLRLSLFITNVPQDTLSTREIQQLYHIRWQIELVFKQWKSTCGINKIPPMKAHRYLCVLYARLILILLYSGFTHLLVAYFYFKQKKLLSQHKCMKTLWPAFTLLYALIRQANQVRKNFMLLIKKVSTGHSLEKKKHKLSSMDLFNCFTHEKKLLSLK